MKEKNPNSYLLFPRKESNKENQTKPKYRSSYLPKREVLLENKNSPMSLDIEKHYKWLKETNNSSTTEANIVSARQSGSVKHLLQLPIWQELENYFLFR